MNSAAKPQLRDVIDVEKKNTDLKIPGFGECLLVVPLWSVIYCGVQLLKPGTLSASQELLGLV